MDKSARSQWFSYWPVPVVERYRTSSRRGSLPLAFKVCPSLQEGFVLLLKRYRPSTRRGSLPLAIKVCPCCPEGISSSCPQVHTNKDFVPHLQPVHDTNLFTLTLVHTTRTFLTKIFFSHKTLAILTMFATTTATITFTGGKDATKVTVAPTHCSCCRSYSCSCSYTCGCSYCNWCP